MCVAEQIGKHYKVFKMAKINRKTQQVFAGALAASGNVAQFGSKKATPIVYSVDPDIIQSLAAWTNGFTSAVINNFSPAWQEMNGIFLLITQQIAYYLQAGIPEWDAGTSYAPASVVSDGTGTIYVSMADDNLNNALSDNTKWLNFYTRKITNVTDNYTVANGDWYIRFTVTPSTGHQTITLPNPALNKGREIRVSLVATYTAYPVIIVASDASTINGYSSANITARWYGGRFISNGTNWYKE